LNQSQIISTFLRYTGMPPGLGIAPLVRYTCLESQVFFCPGEWAGQKALEPYFN